MKYERKQPPAFVPQHWMLTADEIRNAAANKAAQYEYFRKIFEVKDAKKAA